MKKRFGNFACVRTFVYKRYRYPVGFYAMKFFNKFQQEEVSRMKKIKKNKALNFSTMQC